VLFLFLLCWMFCCFHINADLFSFFFIRQSFSLALTTTTHTKHSILSHFFFNFSPFSLWLWRNGKKKLQLLWNIFIETYVFNSRGCKAFCGPLLVFKIVGTLQLHLRYFATGIIYFLIFFYYCVLHFCFFSRALVRLSTN